MPYGIGLETILWENNKIINFIDKVLYFSNKNDVKTFLIWFINNVKC